MENTILTVDYAMSLEEMVAAGNYAYVSDDIKRFPISGSGKVAFEPKSFYFGCRPISSECVVKEMEEKGFRPARIEELLVYGGAMSDEQKGRRLIALGSTVMLKCGRYDLFATANINWTSSYRGRTLSTGWLYEKGYLIDSFLGVREIQPKS